MTETLDHHDDDVRALVRASGSDADAAHVAELRARVLAAATGVGEPARPQRRGEPRRAAMALVGIAAATLLVVTVALAVRDDPAEIATAPATIPATTVAAPSASAVPSTTATPPSTAPPTTSTPVTSTAPTSSTPGLRLAVPDGEIRPGVDDLIATTTGGALVWIRRDDGAVTEQTVLAGGLDAAGGDAVVVGVLRGTVLYRSGERLWAVSSPGATPVQVLDQWVNAAALSRDGSTLAVLSAVTDGQTLALYPTDGGAPTAGSGGEWQSMVWSPDGASLYVTSSDAPLTWISRIDVATGLAPAVTVERYRGWPRVVGFDPDGRPVTWYQGDEGFSQLAPLDPTTLQPTAGVWDRTFPDPGPLVSLSPDGTRLALVDWATGDLTVVSLDGSTSSVATGIADAEFPIVAG